MDRLTRKKVLSRDNNTCLNCGSTKILEVDHIIPIALGGSKEDIENMQVLCKNCHKKKTAKDLMKIRSKMIYNGKNSCTLINSVYFLRVCKNCKEIVIEYGHIYSPTIPIYRTKEPIYCCGNIILGYGYLMGSITPSSLQKHRHKIEKLTKFSDLDKYINPYYLKNI